MTRQRKPGSAPSFRFVDQKAKSGLYLLIGLLIDASSFSARECLELVKRDEMPFPLTLCTPRNPIWLHENMTNNAPLWIENGEILRFWSPK